MSASDVQHRSTFSNGTTSVALAYASNNTAHNLLVYCSSGQVNGSSATDSNTNTIVNATSTGSKNFIDFVQDAHAGANTVTAHSTGTADIHLHIREISGCQTTTQPRDTGVVASSATGSVTTAGATTQIGDAVVAMFDDELANDTLTADGTATDSEITINNTGLDSALSEFRAATASGAQTFTCGGNGTHAMAQTIATFKVLASTFIAEDDSIRPTLPTPPPLYPFVNMSGMQHQDDPAGSLTATVDEYFWLNPGVMTSTLYLQPFQPYHDPDEIPAGRLSATVDEYFWLDPGRMTITLFPQPIPEDPEAIPAGSLSATVDEYFWQSTILPPVAPLIQPLVIDELIVPIAVVFTPDDAYMLNPGTMSYTYYLQLSGDSGDSSSFAPIPPGPIGRSVRFNFGFPAFR